MADMKARLSLRLEDIESPLPDRTDAGASPMTVLSSFMGDLSCVGSTPKRKLSLSGGSTPSLFSRHSSQSSDAGVSVSSLDSEDSDLSGPASSLSNFNIGKPRSIKNVLRRYHSNPPSFDLSSYASPQLFDAALVAPRRTLTLESPNEEEEIIFFTAKHMNKHAVVKNNETANESTSFTTLKAAHGRRFNFANSRPTSAPATLLEQSLAQATVDEDEDSVQLQHSRLTSTNEDEDDDGFCDFTDPDSQEPCSEGEHVFDELWKKPIITAGTDRDLSLPYSASFSALTDAIISPPDRALQSLDCNAIGMTPEPKCRRGIFKVPSQPVIRKCHSFLKRPDRPQDCHSPRKKKARSVSIASPNSSLRSKLQEKTVQKKALTRSYSTTDLDMKRIDEKLSLDAQGLNLTGDGCQSYLLPLVDGKHRDLKTITPETLSKLIQEEYAKYVEEFYIIDARYPYEYDGGHIKGAINLYTREKIHEMFLECALLKLRRRRIIVFHCEFSSQRAPSLLKYLREQDRKANMENYPDLHYPELYILDGGYKNFFESCKEFCEPQEYKPMLHKEHGNDLRHFKAKSKSWTGVSKLKFKNL